MDLKNLSTGPATSLVASFMGKSYFIIYVLKWRGGGLLSLQTGFTFGLTAPDPLHYPLPHPDLLSIHAALMRVARAAGVAAFQVEE